MSFCATIEDAESRLFFCRIISSLNQFNNSEEIKFTITDRSLRLSVFNNLRTSYGEVTIDKEFFSSFDFRSDGFDDEGVVIEKGDGLDSETRISYSFLMRSRLLGMLFKYDPGVASYKMAIGGDHGDDHQMKIEIKNTNLIRKEYNPFYVPFQDEKLNVSKEYKAALSRSLQRQNRNLEEEGDSEIEEINYLSISTVLVKGFLDNVNSNTEDFKIEVNSKKFSMTGYTKKINNKEENFLKQTMATNICFRVEELIDYKLSSIHEDKKIIFRLKDFKNFLNLGQNNEIIEVWFKSSGDPILFEMIKLNCKIQFVQITDSDEHVPNTVGTKTTKLFRENVVVNTGRDRKKTTEKPVEEKEALFLADEDYSPDVPIDEPRTEAATDYNLDTNEQYVGWDDNDGVGLKTNNSKDVIREMRDEYIQKMNKRQKYQDFDEDELGPTQNVTKAKSLFD